MQDRLSLPFYAYLKHRVQVQIEGCIDWQRALIQDGQAFTKVIGAILAVFNGVM